jgi:branched-chain amino acid transport system substrate-binding protein
MFRCHAINDVAGEDPRVSGARLRAFFSTGAKVMRFANATHVAGIAAVFAAGLISSGARADETIKFGLSVPLSGAGAVWGKGAEWMCKRAALEIKEAGGIKVKDKIYNVECVAYDNKYTAAEGTKVAQTLLNRDGAKFLCAVGSAPALAAQSLTERQGVILFNPLTFSIINSPFEIMPAMIKYVTGAHPQAKSIVLLNVNDASGRETEEISKPMWEKAGVKVLTSDFYERGTTEFQPVASRIASLKPDIVDLSSAPPADAGQIFKELEVLGFKGVKITDNGTGAEGLMATGGGAANGVYLGAAMTFDSASATAHQKKVNEEARAYIGESLSISTNGCYDAVNMLKAGMEKAQSTEPKDIAAVMPTVKFKSFYAADIGFGGKEIYGSVQQPVLPVYITQIVDGKVVERAKVEIK